MDFLPLFCQDARRDSRNRDGSMENWFEKVEAALGITGDFQKGVLASVLAIFFLWLIRHIVLRVAYGQYEDIRIRYRWRKTSLYVAVGVGVLVVGSVWFQGFDSISTYLGLVSAGLAIALHAPIVNLAGWAFILWRRPFAVGDRIELGETRGDVIDQRIFMFTVMEIGNWVDADQSTGRVVHVPNGKVFDKPLANYSKGFQYIWDEIPVLVTFESDWRKAKGILAELAEKHAAHLSGEAERQVREAAKKVMIFYSKLTPIVYTSVKDSGVLLTLRYLCDPRRRRTTAQGIWEDILDKFAECPDIDFAYPTQRFYNNMAEGKEQARAKPPSA
jgi:small-conductance mechanosensitive channel